jgi:hypothetical protein
MYSVCGYSGLILAVTFSVSLAAYQKLELWVLITIVAAAICTFFSLAILTKIITGKGKLIYYHHEIAVLMITTLLLVMLDRPVLLYLDITILGVGVFLGCGRVGCLLAGCCHGRLHDWGVRYRIEHAAAGFPPYFVGVRLFPVQALESLWVFGVVFVGGTSVLGGAPQGSALGWYVITYGLGRFFFEFIRGDSVRPYYRGFSQPQWISLMLICLTGVAELFGALPFQLWHVVATVWLVLTMIAVAISRRYLRTPRYQVLYPQHVREVAEAIALVYYLATEPTIGGRSTVMPIGCTSLGIQISAGKIRGTSGYSYHYALSSRDGYMTEEIARILARVVVRLTRESGSSEFLRDNDSIFHLYVHPLS